MQKRGTSPCERREHVLAPGPASMDRQNRRPCQWPPLLAPDLRRGQESGFAGDSANFSLSEGTISFDSCQTSDLNGH